MGRACDRVARNPRGRAPMCTSNRQHRRNHRLDCWQNRDAQSRGCHRRVSGRHSLQTSDALGAAASQLGPHEIAPAVTLNKVFGVPFGKVAVRIRTQFGLTIAPSALGRALHRAAARGQPTYTALCETIRTSAVVVPERTFDAPAVSVLRRIGPLFLKTFPPCAPSSSDRASACPNGSSSV